MTTLPVPSTLLPAPKPLDTSDDAWLAWKTWKSEFELFATATQLTKQPSDVQAATFLVSIGEEGRKAYSTFKFEAQEDKKDVQVLSKKFEDYYRPANNLTLHEFRFGSRDQKEGESFNDWLIELKILAKNCEFELLEDRMLRSRIVLGVRDKRLQQKLLAENPTYQKAVVICRIDEQGKQHFQEISAATGGAHTIVNAVASERNMCTRCGYQAHRGGNCPARGKNCRKCGAPNHFAQVCKALGPKQTASRQGKQLREVRAETDDFFLAGLTRNSLEADRWTATVYIEGQPLSCKLDTGANCCVIAKQELARLSDKPKQACNVTLTAFFGHRATAQAKVRLLLSVNNRKCEEEFFVVDQDVAVTLSGAVAERLGLIYRVQKVETEELYSPAQPFADIFSGLGQLKDVEYSIKLKPGSVGTVVPARRVPVALQEKVLMELQRMEQQGVITKVTEPTEWSSHMVTVVKKDKVRICLDPTALNRELLRENYPMPTLEDIVPRLSGAKFFSTLDAASGFWQIKLTEESSKICTMSTPYGRYRFLRMPFGISSAPEIFQAAMHRLLDGLPGVAVVMDDILVWGKTRDEHDCHLTLLLTRCREHNLRLNLKKCTFLQTEVRYLGHILTTQGLRIDPERVQAILEIPEPKTSKQLQVFLGTVNFVQRFIPNMSVLTEPLRELLRKDNAWVWTEKQQASFEALRQILITAPVLSYFDLEKALSVMPTSWT